MKIIASIALDGRSAGSWYAVETARRLQTRGHDVLFIPRPKGQTITMAREAGLPVIDDLDLEEKSPKKMYRNLRRIIGLIGQFSPDVVLAHWGEDHALWGLAKSLHKRKPVLIRVRALDPKPPKRHPLSIWLHRRATDMIVTSNDRLASAYRIRLKIPPEKLHVIPAGIDPRLWDGNRGNRESLSRLGVPADCPIVVLLARFSPVKGHRVMLSAVPHIQERHPNARFLWLGFPSEYDAGILRRWFVEGNLTEQITVVDTMIPDLYSVIAQCAVGIVASIGSESVSRSLLEYMLCGIPVVATDVGGIPDLMRQGEFGRMVPPDDTKALAQAISDLLDNPSLRVKYGQNARAHILQHATWDQRVDEWEDLLHRTVSRVRGDSLPRPSDPESRRDHSVVTATTPGHPG
jgi:glycosyltransferase involved in cell wall biosynthesis